MANPPASTLSNSPSNSPAISPPKGFDWSLIRSFLAALEAGTLLGASRRLGVSQPTVGRQISELESQLGLVLFERTGRGLSPTASALQLADAARAAYVREPGR